jgi:hypothetical protein
MIVIDQALADRGIGGNGLLPGGEEKWPDCSGHEIGERQAKPLLRHARACPEHLQRVDQ